MPPMPMMYVGQVVMRVLPCLMPVFVGVAAGRRSLMVMLMVSVIVNVGMLVDQQLVEMLMLVLFVKQQPRGSQHERKRKPEQPVGKPAEKDQGQHDARQRRAAKEGAGTGSPKTAHCTNEQDQAEPVAQAAQKQRLQDDAGGGQTIAQRNRRRQGNSPGRQPFDGHNRQWILGGYVAREIVVNAPQEAGQDNSQCPHREAPPPGRLYGKQRARDRDQGH